MRYVNKKVAAFGLRQTGFVSNINSMKKTSKQNLQLVGGAAPLQALSVSKKVTNVSEEHYCVGSSRVPNILLSLCNCLLLLPGIILIVEKCLWLLSFLHIYCETVCSGCNVVSTAIFSDDSYVHMDISHTSNFSLKPILASINIEESMKSILPGCHAARLLVTPDTYL